MREVIDYVLYALFVWLSRAELFAGAE